MVKEGLLQFDHELRIKENLYICIPQYFETLFFP